MWQVGTKTKLPDRFKMIVTEYVNVCCVITPFNPTGFFRRYMCARTPKLTTKTKTNPTPSTISLTDGT